MQSPNKISTIFSGLKDHRVNRTKLHPLENIVFISTCAVICGAETWNEIEAYGNSKKEWLSGFLDLSSGIPSHDTFNRFFSLMHTATFEECFRQWVSTIVSDIKGDFVSIDGKTVRGSKGFESTALHIVSAWSAVNQISLGQLRTAEKSNEITAIPELLESLLIEGSTVTIDAMGCHTAIARKIVSKGADYILAVKNNQRTLYSEIQDSFTFVSPESESVEEDFGHGRIEKRTCSVINNLGMIGDSVVWSSIQSIIRIECHRYNKTTSESDTSTRYYISSLNTDAKYMATAIRSHWGIENNLHWMLDVSFGEDRGRKRNKSAVMNFSTLNKIALYLLKNDSSQNVGVRSKRMIAGWDQEYLMKIIGGF